MKFRLYFIVTFIIGLLSYALNWNSLSNIDPNCSKDVLKISNKLLFTSSIVLLVLSIASVFKNDNVIDIELYSIIFLIISLFFIVLSIINLVNGKQIKQSPTTTPTTTPKQKIEEYTECISNIVSIINLLLGITLGIYSVYHIKNIINFNII